MKKRTANIKHQYHILFSVAAIFAVMGILLILRSSAATTTKAFEAEDGQTAGKAAIALTSGFSGSGYATVNTGTTGGQTVPLPSGHPTGTLTSIADDKTWGMVSCATDDPICIFTWQTGDMYNEPRGTRSDCGCAEIRNIQTGAVIKKINLMEAANSPKNGYRPYPIYNPFKKEWLVVTQSTRLGWDGGSDEDLDRPYGFRVSLNGDLVGPAIALSQQFWRGWVPHGVFDTATRKYYVEWHQMVVDYGRKDILATVLDEDGTVTDMDFNIDKTPSTLDEYSSAVYNSVSGEIISIHSAADADDCDNCTRNIDSYRLKIDSAGKLSIVAPKVRFDSDNMVEWGLHASYNQTTNSIVVVYRNGPNSRDEPGMTDSGVVVLDGQGALQASEANLGGTSGGYWTTGTACSTRTNLCTGAVQTQSVYIDAASTGTTKISSIGASGVNNFSFPGTRAGYSPSTDSFYLYGSNGYVTAAGR